MCYSFFFIEELRQWAKAYGIELENDNGIVDDELLVKLAPHADGILDKDRPANLPLGKPTFTLKTIKEAIPSHCFKVEYLNLRLFTLKIL